MSDESVSVAILLSSENIPKEIFVNSVNEYFGPQVEDFKNSSLSICVLSDKTGLEPSKINSAVFIKSQWMFQTTLTSNEIFEFKLTICENKSWFIVLSEDLFETRLIETFKIHNDEILVVHLEWNKPHTVSVESFIDLYSMDESLIKSHYENQETSELFKNLETITEDNFDDESLMDSLREESKKSNENNKTENHDTDDSLETRKEYDKNTIKLSDDESKINISENYVLNKVEESINYIEKNKEDNKYLKGKENYKISNMNSQRKDVLLKKIQSILGVKSELNRIKLANLMKDNNSITFTNPNQKKIFIANKCKMEKFNLIYSSIEVETDNVCNMHEIEFKKSIIIPYLREVKELKLTVALEMLLQLNVQENTFTSLFFTFIEDIHKEIIKDKINYSNHEHNIHFKNFEIDNLNSNKLVSDNISKNLKIQRNNENEKISLEYMNHQNTKFYLECSVPIEEETFLNPDILVDKTSQPYLCVLVIPCEEIQNIKFPKESKAMETFENVSVNFYHENVFQPKINRSKVFINKNMYIKKDILHLTCQSKNELTDIKTSRHPISESENTNDNLMYEDLNYLNIKLTAENMINQNDVKHGDKIETFQASKNFSENLKTKNEIFSIEKDERQNDEVQVITYETPPNVGNIIVKFETLTETETSCPKMRLDKQKNQNRISDIVKQFEGLNLSKDQKNSTNEIKFESIETKEDQSKKPFKSIKEKNLSPKNNDVLIVVKDKDKGNMNINQEQHPELRINDDYKYPDSVTPTKVEHTLSQLKVYDVPFIDDDVFLKDSSFKDSTEELNFHKFDNSLNTGRSIIKITPKASIETLQEIDIEKIKLSIETVEPVKKRKGLLDLCGCVGGRKRS